MTASNSNPPKTWVLWAGRVLSAIPVLMLLMSASMKLMQGEEVVKGFADFGYPQSALVMIGVVEIVCAVLYAIPQTAVLGAILATGYLGGAVATHVRVGEGFAGFGPAIGLGVLIWAGLYLRDVRLRALVPLRR